MFLAERVDQTTWTTLKQFVEWTIDENFQPKPKRKKARCAADENDTGRCEVQVDNENTERQTMINMITHTYKNKMDYEDYSNLDPILPLEGSLRPSKDDKIMKIPGLEDLD